MNFPLWALFLIRKIFLGCFTATNSSVQHVGRDVEFLITCPKSHLQWFFPFLLSVTHLCKAQRAENWDLVQQAVYQVKHLCKYWTNLRAKWETVYYKRNYYLWLTDFQIGGHVDLRHRWAHNESEAQPNQLPTKLLRQSFFPWGKTAGAWEPLASI